MMEMTRRNNNLDVKVGDTPADTVMGKAAGVGLNVGVLRFTATFRITLLSAKPSLSGSLSSNNAITLIEDYSPLL